MTLKSLRIAAEFGIIAGVGYIAFTLVTMPIRWAIGKLKEWRK